LNIPPGLDVLAQPLPQQTSADKQIGDEMANGVRALAVTGTFGLSEPFFLPSCRRGERLD
jgi:hypothetical protein